MVLKTYMSLLCIDFKILVRTSLFFDEFASLLEIICSFDSDIILSGDANIHLDIALDFDIKKFLNCYMFNLLRLLDSITHNKGH